MTKVIRFKLDDGIYEFDASIIADARAKYYATFDLDNNFDVVYTDAWKQIYQDEYDLLMNAGADTYDFTDWLLNDMHFEDIEPHMKRVADIPKRSLKEQWRSIQGSEHFQILELDNLTGDDV